MSVDFFLVSPSRKRAVMVGSVNLAGTSAWPSESSAAAFLRWAMDESIDDVELVNEDRLAVIQGDDESDWSEPVKS